MGTINCVSFFYSARLMVMLSVCCRDHVHLTRCLRTLRARLLPASAATQLFSHSVAARARARKALVRVSRDAHCVVPSARLPQVCKH